MTFKDMLEREKYVVVHGQTARFRVRKYLMFLLIFAVVFSWKGVQGLIVALPIAIVFALAVHFLFRWKTNAWTKSWWLYKKMNLPK